MYDDVISMTCEPDLKSSFSPPPPLQVKVMVRVCPVSQLEAAESSSFLKVDPRKKQIMIMDPSANQTQASQKRAGANQVSPKMFTFDAAFPPDASQVGQTAWCFYRVIQCITVK